MKISAQEEYGIRFLLLICQKNREEGITIPEISKAEGIGQPHVAKVMSMLKRSGFVKSIRGQHGGYLLNREPESILLSDVINSLGGRIFNADYCGRFIGHNQECIHLSSCKLHALWGKIQIAIDRTLHGITLADLSKGLDPSELKYINVMQTRNSLRNVE